MREFQDRKFIILIIFFLIGFIYVFRLFYIQVIDSSYKLSANNQALRHTTLYPPRGLIYDRNNELLVYNEAAYDLMVVPRQVKTIDTLAFCELLNVSKEYFIEKMNKARKYSTRKASIFQSQITAEHWASISEKLYLFPGFYGDKRTLRKYPTQSAGHVLGYVSEVGKKDLERDKYYKRGDNIGASGIEKYYERELRGVRGVSIRMVDVHNRIKGSYKNGQYDTLPIPGKDLQLTLDGSLQNYGETLMANKRGSIVAIEPKTGEILALISCPNYDPNLLIGRDRSKNYKLLLNNDSLNPLFNRALMAQYAPGSIFKMVQALIAMQEGVISKNTGFPCNKGLIGCHDHPAPNNIEKAIQFSCNPYFYEAFKKLIQSGKSSSIFKDSELGLGNWRTHILSFGMGQKLPIDFPIIKSGHIPSVAFYDRLYGDNRWAFSTIYSLSIGQGEIQVVPLQMANLAATIANKGYYFTPHFVRSIGGEDISIDQRFLQKHYTTVEGRFYNSVIDAMQTVVEADHGTARRARIDSITVCGKTGTVENPHGEDHSVFMAFAPKENPKIAIVVYVENAGFGGTWAAPISSLMIEKYLTGAVKQKAKEQRILDADFLSLENK